MKEILIMNNSLLKEDKFHIRTYLASCHCKCEFCCLGDYDKSKCISFEQYANILRKYKDVENYGFRLKTFIYNCIEHNHVGNQLQLYYELNLNENEFTHLDINGTRIRHGKELEEWIDNLIKAGIKQASFSWFGLSETHNKFVNRDGYFEYLVSVAKYCHKKGVKVGSKIFLYKSMLAELDALIHYIKDFSTSIKCAMMEYTGDGKKLEESFISKSDLDNLSEFSKQYLSPEYISKFLPESEWYNLAVIDNFPRFKIVDYIIYVDSDNYADNLESSIPDMIDYFRNFTNDFLGSFESVKQLALQFGSPDNDKLFEARDMLRKWLDLYSIDANLDKSLLFSFTHNSIELKLYERL